MHKHPDIHGLDLSFDVDAFPRARSSEYPEISSGILPLKLTLSSERFSVVLVSLSRLAITESANCLFRRCRYELLLENLMPSL